MKTPKIFILKINSRPPWEVQEPKLNYVSDYEYTTRTYDVCDFDYGAQKFTLEEASKIAATLNKIHLNYTEITIPKEYGSTTIPSKGIKL
jgi:hypothetical protein